MHKNHGFIEKLSRHIARDPHRHCGYPEYEFYKTAEAVGCEFDQIIAAFSSILDVQKLPSEITNPDEPNFLENSVRQKRLHELKVFSAWRIQFAVKDPVRKKKQTQYDNAIRKAESSVSRLIVAMEDVSKIEGHDRHKKFRNENVPSLHQLRNLKQELTAEIDVTEKAKIYAVDSERIRKSKPHADLIAICMEQLFTMQSKKITRGSSDETSSSEFTVALESAFKIFGISAKGKTYARKIVDSRNGVLGDKKL